MKKLYVYATALALSFGAQAQSIFDFESHALAAESYDNGSAGNGDFIFTQTESIGLSNYYDSTGGWWTGFSISNITDNTTPGWGNQYSAYPGAGAGDSENYGVFYYAGNLYTNGPMMAITEFKITNATYSALSMLNGDSFAKKFGSPNDAYGNPDGTNGEDFFKVWIICEDEQGTKDSLDFYLADYRFADSTQDYIVDTWETIDLTVLPIETANISFRFESSDNDSVFGMNTPAYFAIDDVQAVHLAGLSEQMIDVRVSPNPASDMVHVSGGEGRLTIADLNGSVVYASEHFGESTISLGNLSPAVYVIHIESASGSYTNRLMIH